MPFGFRIACRRASWPTSRSPCAVKATTDGVVRDPSALGITVGLPASVAAMTEFVVPRSMPTAIAITDLLLRGCEHPRLRRGLAACPTLPARGSGHIPHLDSHGDPLADVAGGDGTVRAASAIALETGLPLLVIPAGTFNHFAADLGVRSARDAVAALRAGEAVLVDVGIAAGRPFVNTSSTGVYVDLVHARQESRACSAGEVWAGAWRRSSGSSRCCGAAARTS